MKLYDFAFHYRATCNWHVIDCITLQLSHAPDQETVPMSPDLSPRRDYRLGTRQSFLLTHCYWSWHQHMVCIAGRIVNAACLAWCNLIICIMPTVHTLVVTPAQVGAWLWLHDCILYVILWQALLYLGNHHAWLCNAPRHSASLNKFVSYSELGD